MALSRPRAREQKCANRSASLSSGNGRGEAEDFEADHAIPSFAVAAAPSPSLAPPLPKAAMRCERRLCTSVKGGSPADCSQALRPAWAAILSRQPGDSTWAMAEEWRGGGRWCAVMLATVCRDEEEGGRRSVRREARGARGEGRG